MCHCDLSRPSVLQRLRGLAEAKENVARGAGHAPTVYKPQLNPADEGEHDAVTGTDEERSRVCASLPHTWLRAGDGDEAAPALCRAATLGSRDIAVRTNRPSSMICSHSSATQSLAAPHSCAGTDADLGDSITVIGVRTR